MESIDYKKLIEAALFMSQNPLSIKELSDITGIASPGYVESLLKELVSEFSTRNTPLEISEIGGKYTINVKEPYASMVSKLAAGPDITKGALRILAYISKNDGELQSNIVKIFGETTYAYVKELLEKEFLSSKRSGRSKKLYITTKFREYFNA
ncbi:MAG: SMC-Scp complex subunit ScpB [Candidatus Micrarchaeaceae archaeon]